ncbi:hypothetical protein, partial [Mesorhizobium sp. M0500]|uniref:hypothetical protein n=1 Tax=Mesorhizobium sp. M0500 TaxID=2956953 RepID=UPI003338E1DE
PDQTRYRSRFEGHPSKALASTCSENSAYLFVKLIGWYLADYRSVFEDEVRRRKLVDCLALFVEAGWPEARRLFQSLPELLQ